MNKFDITSEILNASLSNSKSSSIFTHAHKRAVYSKFREEFLKSNPKVSFYASYKGFPYFSTRHPKFGLIVFNYTTMGYIDNDELKILYCLGASNSIRDMEKFFYMNQLQFLKPLSRLVNRSIHATNIFRP